MRRDAGKKPERGLRNFNVSKKKKQGFQVQNSKVLQKYKACGGDFRWCLCVFVKENTEEQMFI